MGGQACVLYGAAEFSRDTDFALLAEPGNLERLRLVLTELRAVVTAVPPFELRYLRRGHAVHFRCWHPEAPRVRIDVMSRMRGVDEFRKLWRRRTSIELPGGIRSELVSLPDLKLALKGDFAQLVRGLDKEEKAEREKDRRYWAPLKAELEALRRARMRE